MRALLATVFFLGERTRDWRSSARRQASPARFDPPVVTTVVDVAYPFTERRFGHGRA